MWLPFVSPAVGCANHVPACQKTDCAALQVFQLNSVAATQEGSEVVLRVHDTGAGIDPALLPHIFDLFTQAKRSLARSEGDLGLGLALVKRLVELHGGRVEAFSTPGIGSEFVVRLPATTLQVLLHAPVSPDV